MDRRRVLLASYYFPPDAAVGGLRIAKFVRFLPEFGWTPYVLTVHDGLRDQGLDPSRLEGLEDVSISRTSELPRVVTLYTRMKSRLRHGERRTGSTAPTPQTERVDAGETLGRRFKRFVISLLVYLPDERKNWSLYAAGTAVRLIRKHRIDCVLTSGPPFSVHVIGLIAKLFTGARWIADFRDPWIDMLQDRFPETRSSASDRIERWMEAAVVRCADKVVTTTDHMRAAMSARYPSAPRDRFLTVQNSIDSERLRLRGPVEKYEPLTITYTGALYFDRTPEPLFRAVSELIQREGIRDTDIRIKLLGNCRQIHGVETMSLAGSYGLGRVVEVVDTVPYAEAVRVMQKSHLLLILAPERHRLVVPAKLFDYLGSGSKLLALAEPGATSDLMHETGSGRCFSESNVADLRDYLYELLRDRNFRELGNEPATFSRYDVRCLTGRLVSEALEGSPQAARAVTVRT